MFIKKRKINLLCFASYPNIRPKKYSAMTIITAFAANNDITIRLCIDYPRLDTHTIMGSLRRSEASCSLR